MLAYIPYMDPMGLGSKIRKLTMCHMMSHVRPIWNQSWFQGHFDNTHWQKWCAFPLYVCFRLVIDLEYPIQSEQQALSFFVGFRSRCLDQEMVPKIKTNAFAFNSKQTNRMWGAWKGTWTLHSILLAFKHSQMRDICLRIWTLLNGQFSRGIIFKHPFLKLRGATRATRKSRKSDQVIPSRFRFARPGVFPSTTWICAPDSCDIHFTVAPPLPMTKPTSVEFWGHLSFTEKDKVCLSFI